MKRCAKTNCIKNSITRGKYCEEHRVRKKAIQETIQRQEVIQRQETIQIPETIQQSLVEQERRFLIDDQNKEYEETMRLDILRNQQKEQQMIEKAIKDSEMDQIRHLVFSNEKSDNSFNIKFSINGKQNIHYFNHDAFFKDIFQYIDLYLYDTKTEMEYDLIYYPNIVFSKDEYNEKKIMDFFNCKCLSLLVRNKKY